MPVLSRPRRGLSGQGPVTAIVTETVCRTRAIWNLGSLLYRTFFGCIPTWLYSTSQTAIYQGCYIHFLLYSNMLYSHSVEEGGI